MTEVYFPIHIRISSFYGCTSVGYAILSELLFLTNYIHMIYIFILSDMCVAITINIHYHFLSFPISELYYFFLAILAAVNKDSI